MPAEVYEWDYGGRRVTSPRLGGQIEFNGPILKAVQALSEIDKAKLTTWIVETNRLGTPSEHWPSVTSEVLEQVKAARPYTTGRRIERLMEFLGHLDYRPGTRPDWLINPDADPRFRQLFNKALAWTESESEAAFHAIRRLAVDEGYLELTGTKIQITVRGFQKIEELRLGGAPTDQVFVAMWFDSSTQSAYENGIVPALHDAGFRPLRIDQKEHSNKIDDEIIAELRRSRFVVADFTCGILGEGEGQTFVARGGVYYEAGFAQGLGTPVIWCVRSDQIKGVHFDTRQFNHITWDSADDLRIKLFNRVRAMF